MLLRLPVLFVFGLLAGCKAHHEALPPRPVSVASKTFTFPSGLRVVVEPERGSKRLAIAMLVGAGSAQDGKDREGTAHFVEHLAYRSRPGNRLTAWEELDFAGLASINAFTRAETTAYVGVTASSRVNVVLPMMAAVVANPLAGVDDAAIEVERNVLKSERFDSDPHAGGAVSDAIVAAVFPPGFPGARSVGGTNASLNNITRGDLEAFQREFYQPANTIVVLIGDVPLETAEALVQTSFPREWLTAPAGPIEPRHKNGAVGTKIPNPVPSSQRPIVESRVKHRRLVFTWAVPGLAQPSGSAMPLVRDALDEVLKKPKGVRRLSTSLVVDAHISLLSVTAELEDDANPDDVSYELRKLERFGSFSVGEWQRAARDTIMDEQHLLDRAEERALSLFGTGRVARLFTGPDEEQLRSLKLVESDVLTWSRSREVLVVPFVRTNTGGGEALAQVAPPRRRVAIDQAALEAVALGPSVGETRQFTLENGLEVLVSRRPSVPVASVALGLPGRAQHAGREVEAFLSTTLKWELDEKTWKVGRPWVDVGADATVVQLAGESTNLPLMLDVLGHNLPPSVSWFTVDKLNDVVEKLEKQDELRSALDEVEARELALKVMPAKSSAVPAKLAELKDMQRSRFVDFVDLAWRPDGAWLVIDGDVDLEPTEQIVRELFTSWSRGDKPLPPAPSPGAPPGREKKTKVVENQDAAVTRVRFACRVPGGQPSDVGGVALLEDALADFFEDELRRELGLTYGVVVSATRWTHEDNMLSLSVVLNPANKQTALRRFLKKLQDLDGAVWDEQQVDVARWHVAKGLVGSRLTSSAVAFDLAAAGASGLSREVMLAKPRTYAKAPLRAVDDAWALCNDTWFLEVEGERSSIETALKEAGL